MVLTQSAKKHRPSGLSPVATVIFAMVAVTLLASCASLETGPMASRSGPSEAVEFTNPPADRTIVQEPVQVELLGEGAPRASLTDRDVAEQQLLRGTGRFFDRERAEKPAQVDERTGEVSLNFEAADLREVTAFILGELLELNHLIGEGVQGQVTLQTSRPLSRDALLPTLEQILRLHGVVIVPVEGVYQVLRRDGALQGTVTPRLGAGQPGFGVRIVPLEYIAAREMHKILEPFLSPGGAVRVDTHRNLLILAGTQQELAQWMEMVEIFDVDWLKGMSVGLFTLKNAEVGPVAEALQGILNEAESPVQGMFRLVPVERLNVLLVITQQPRYLEEARDWIARLDRPTDMDTPQLYVYRMQNGKADDVASVLTEVYGGTSERRRSAPEPDLAPGLNPVELGSEGSNTQNGSGEGSDRDSGPATSVLSGAGLGGVLGGEVRIISDDANNALLILASPRDYEIIERALGKLDIPPLQVLIDATIIEVTLTDELRYGLQWFFKDNFGSGYSGRGVLGFGESATLSQTFPGFNYSIVDSASQVRAVLSALAQDSRVNVLSSPSVMVLDNRSATIRVGDQVPVRTSETTSVVTDNPVIVSNIQFRDTGVSLEVTPRVNAGGMVVMEVKQEVNDVTRTTTSGIDSPTIQQRLIESSVAVQSGETVVLGGLIRDSSSQDETGIPGLYRLPLLGPLFGTTTTSTRRTELLILITPRVARDVHEARVITNEFRERLRGLGERALYGLEVTGDRAQEASAE